MKAQSELIGDNERVAEMTAPCESRATKWMDRITKLAKALTSSTNAVATTAAACKLSDFEIPEVPKITINPEVNYCPADQQWSVCTP